MAREKPQVLKDLPPSCSKIFSVLCDLSIRTNSDLVQIGTRALAKLAGISQTSTHRALRRLKAVGLIEEVGLRFGRTPACYRILWNCDPFPTPLQRKNPPHPPRTKDRQGGNKPPAKRGGIKRPPKVPAFKSWQIRDPKAALRYAAFRVRAWASSLPPHKAEQLISAILKQIWKYLKNGLISLTNQLRRYLDILLARLTDALPDDPRWIWPTIARLGAEVLEESKPLTSKAKELQRTYAGISLREWLQSQGVASVVELIEQMRAGKIAASGDTMAREFDLTRPSLNYTRERG